MRALLLLPLLLAGCFQETVLEYDDFLERIPPCPELGSPSFRLSDLFNSEVEAAKAAFHVRGYERVEVEQGATGVAPDVIGYCNLENQTGAGP